MAKIKTVSQALYELKKSLKSYERVKGELDKYIADPFPKREEFEGSEQTDFEQEQRYELTNE